MGLWNFHPPVALLFSSSQEGIQLFDRIWLRSTWVSVRRLCDVVPQHIPHTHGLSHSPAHAILDEGTGVSNIAAVVAS
jgi:hypothetical protein